MDRHDRIEESLATMPLFARCSKRERRRIARLATRVSVAAGTVLAEEGAPGHELIVILEGRATVTERGRLLAVRGPGEYFGEVALLGRCRRTATVVADTQMVIAVIARPEFAGLLADSPGLERALLTGMAERLGATSAAMSESGDR